MESPLGDFVPLWLLTLPTIRTPRHEESFRFVKRFSPYCVQSTNMIPIQTLLIFFVLMASPQTTSVRGRVLDSRTLEPIEKATVSIRDRKVETRTAANGE